MRILLFGPGYVGLPLALELKKLGHDVVAVARSHYPELEAAGISIVNADVTDPASLAALPLDCDRAINLIASSGPDSYRAVYTDGSRNILNALPARVVLLQASSTSVYAQDDGEWVDESSPTTPATPTGQALVDMERIVTQSGRGAVLRISGIYGPGRGHLFKQFVAGAAKITGKAGRHLNMVHRDDIISAFIKALDHGRAGETYNITDNEPVKQTDFYAWLAAQLNRPMPPADPSDTPSKRGITDKRVRNDNARRELKWELRYPSYREGFAEEIRALGAGA